MTGNGRWTRRWDLPPIGRRPKSWRDRYRHAITVGVELGLLRRCDLALVLLLLDAGGAHGSVVTGRSQGLLGRLAGCCVRTVGGQLAHLRAGGWIDWHHRIERLANGQVRQLPNVYRLVIPEAVEAELKRRRREGHQQVQRPKPSHQGGGERPHPVQDFVDDAPEGTPASPDGVRAALAAARGKLNRARAPDWTVTAT